MLIFSGEIKFVEIHMWAVLDKCAGAQPGPEWRWRAVGANGFAGWCGVVVASLGPQLASEWAPLFSGINTRFKVFQEQY